MSAEWHWLLVRGHALLNGLNELNRLRGLNRLYRLSRWPSPARVPSNLFNSFNLFNVIRRDSLGAAFEGASGGGIAIFVGQESHLKQRLMVVGLKIERFTVAINRTAVAARITKEAEKIIAVSGVAAAAQMCFA